MDQIKIGKFIAICRKENNLTQEQLAEKLSVSNKTVSRWENGNGFPDISLLQPLCDILNISVNELLLGEKIPEDNYRKKVEEHTIRILEETQNYLESGRYFNNNVEEIDFGKFGIVSIVFIILKLTGTITWSWFWVLSPLWIGLSLCAIIATVFLIIMRKKIRKNSKIKFKMPRIKIKFF